MKGTERLGEIVEILLDADQPDAATWQREVQIARDRVREWLRRIHSGGSLTLAEYVRAEEDLASLSLRRRGGPQPEGGEILKGVRPSGAIQGRRFYAGIGIPERRQFGTKWFSAQP